MGRKLKIVRPRLGWVLTTVKSLIQEMNEENRFKQKVDELMIECDGSLFVLKRVKKGGE